MPAPGSVTEVVAAGHTLCIANVDGTLHAMDGICPHRGGPLGQGTLEGNAVLCPWHAWAFDLTTGRAEHSPQASVAVYPIELEGDDVIAAL